MILNSLMVPRLRPAIAPIRRSSLFHPQFRQSCNLQLSVRVRYSTNNNYQTH